MTEIRYEVTGKKEAIALIGALPEEADKASRNAANQAARATRRILVDAMIEATGLKRKVLNAGMYLILANTQRQYAAIRPRGSGIPASEYPWQIAAGPDPFRSPTRQRYTVPWFGGRKLAPGFINPLAHGGWYIPMRSRIDNRSASQRSRGVTGSGKGGPRVTWIKPEPAIALSAAAIFKELLKRRPDILDGAADDLSARFVEALKAQIAKR